MLFLTLQHHRIAPSCCTSWKTFSHQEHYCWGLGMHLGLSQKYILFDQGFCIHVPKRC